ncbi:MAG: hypothetical protein DWQ04_21200 [Chloroflexi bacterium]|nr:MAG: hypothetical protein DWQ04_21200 [Chloroflexota bacterium]
MSDSASGIWSLNSQDGSIFPGGRETVKWEIVARTMGLMPATIIAGRLHAEGIRVRTWQEGAGRAIGLMVGALGTGYVAVPEELVDQALLILKSSDYLDEFDEDEEE